MIGKDEVTLVIPVLNEEEAIGLVLDEARREGYSHVLVVDGGSTDSTVRVAESRGVRVVSQHGWGKAGAVKTAIDLVETPYLAFMDGDYTYDVRDLERLLAHGDRYDLVIGARRPEAIPKLHRFGNRIINLAFNTLFASNLSDVCSGMYLLRRDAARRLDLRSRGFDVEVEIAAQCCYSGKVAEVPIGYRRRIGEGKLKTWRAGFRILASLLSLVRSYNPIFLFSTLASLLTIPGALILLWELTLRYLHGAGAWSEGMAWLGLTLLIVGLQGFSLSTISLLLRRIERRILSIVKA